MLVTDDSPKNDSSASLRFYRYGSACRFPSGRRPRIQCEGVVLGECEGAAARFKTPLVLVYERR